MSNNYGKTEERWANNHVKQRVRASLQNCKLILFTAASDREGPITGRKH